MGGTDNVCSILCEILISGIDVHRLLAAQALGHIGGDKAVDALIKGLLDEDEDVRTDVATALVRLNDSRADKQLLENLIGDPCPEVKLAAMTALAATENEEAKPWLLRILAGRDEGIFWDEDEFFTTGWDDWADMQVKAMNALADLGVEEAIPEIVSTINDIEAQDITDTAMKALSRIGTPGVVALAGFHGNEDERLRRNAVSVLSNCDGEEATNAVYQALRDPSSAVRLAVARGLAGKNPADERLVVLLLDEMPEVRAETVRLCGEHHQNRLDLLLDDKNSEVLLAVLELLAEHPELTNIPMLDERVRELMHSPSVPVAASAAAAFAAVSPENAVPELVMQLAREGITVEARRGAIRGLKIAGGDEALQALIDVLDCEDRQIRLDTMAAIAVLAADTVWPNAAGDTLLAALSGMLVPEPETESEAENNREIEGENEALTESGDETIDEDGVAIEEDEEPEDVHFPTSTLDAIVGKSDSEESLPPPEDMELTPEDLEFLILTGGEKKGKRKVPVVPDVVPHEDVRLFAARLLGNFPHPDVTLALLDPLSSHNMELKQAAVDSLAHITGNLSELPAETVDALKAEGKSSSRDIRLKAIRALGFSNDTSVVMVLINALDDEDSFVRTEAIHALGRHGEAGAGVRRFLEDPDSSVRLAAARALAKTKASGVVETLVGFAFAFEGYHGREAAKLLVDIDRQEANSLFIEAIKDESRKRFWKVAIEALEELNKGQVSAQA